MPPQMSKYGTSESMEDTPLTTSDGDVIPPHKMHKAVDPLDISLSSFVPYGGTRETSPTKKYCALLAACAVSAAGLSLFVASIVKTGAGRTRPVGPYKLKSCQEGEDFFDHYDFYDGADSLGSAGYNTYVGKKRAKQLGIANVTLENAADVYHSSKSSEEQEQFIYMNSAATDEGPRESIRLEGKHRYNNGLFILDLRHMPAGCGIWPAFWLTDEKHWPDNGEIDIVEGINYQNVAKTALHTSDRCSMYANVPGYAKTGTWDWATGLPDRYTGVMDFNTNKEADDCNALAPHQWANQGCVAVSDEDGSLGEPVNANGGGVYALEWDPEKEHAIRSWAFSSHGGVPSNLRDAIQSAGNADKSKRVVPDPNEWGLPYGYFAVGEGTGCSADHFKDMRIVFNLAFCGTVAGNRYFRDCPAESKLFKKGKDPVKSCNAWIKSNPEAMDEAYWKIRGLYVYERSWVKPTAAVVDDDSD